MKASRYIQKELQAINSLYFAVYDEPHFKWRIRKWKSMHRMNHVSNHWTWDSTPIVSLEIHEDLSMNVIHTMNKGFYHARNYKRLLEEIDVSNDKLEASHDTETEYIGRDMAKQIWHHYQEKTIDLGG